MKFIEVNRTGENCVVTEVFPIENLIKMFKCEGSRGEGIGFHVFDPICNRDVQFLAYYYSNYIRDRAWDEYQLALGTVRASEIPIAIDDKIMEA